MIRRTSGRWRTVVSLTVSTSDTSLRSAANNNSGDVLSNVMPHGPASTSLSTSGVSRRTISPGSASFFRSSLSRCSTMRAWRRPWTCSSATAAERRWRPIASSTPASPSRAKTCAASRRPSGLPFTCSTSRSRCPSLTGGKSYRFNRARRYARPAAASKPPSGIGVHSGTSSENGKSSVRSMPRPTITTRRRAISTSSSATNFRSE